MIDVLGDLRVRVDDRDVVIGSRSQRLVLAVLAAHPDRVVGIDVLVDALWEDHPPETARRTLGSYVSRLRSTLGDAVEISHGGYRLVTADTPLDARRFEVLVAQAGGAAPSLAVELYDDALSLVRGPVFGEFADLDTVRPSARRLESLIVDAAEARAGALLDAGRAAEAAAAASELVTQHPLRETAWTVLVDAQARSAPGEALRSYRRAVTELAEVGLVPSERLRAAESRALLGESGDVVTAPPPPRSGLIGRRDDLVELGVLLNSHRLVTLVGPGGVGKTRLATELGVRRRSEHRLGTHLVSLDEVAEAAAVGAAIVERLGVDGVSIDPIVDLARVGDLDLLLVIDNCEHLLDAAADAIGTILAGGGAARIVATSRQRLGLEGERVWATPPLGGRGRRSDVDLFVERAAELGVDVADARDSVERIVELLDGLPLAIEMAAALLSSHGLDDLERVVRSNAAVLRAPNRATPRRQRTLADLVDWSLDHLDPASRDGAIGLSVFEGSFDRSDAAAMIGDGCDHVVHDLVERSLLAADTTSTSASYRMLRTIKSRVQGRGAGARLARSRNRHVEHHVGLLVDADRALRSSDESEADQRITAMYADLRSAHLWATDHHSPDAVEITRRLHVWAMSRQVGDPFRWAERLIGDPATAPPVALAARSQAWFYRGRADEAAELAEAALQRADGIDRLLLLESLGDIVLARGDLERAIVLGDELAQTAEGADDAHFVVMGRCAQALAHGYSGRCGDGLDIVTRLDASAPTDRGWIAYTHAELVAADHPNDAAVHLHAAIRDADAVNNRFLAGVARVSLASSRAEGGDPAQSVHDLTQTIEHWQRRGMHAYLLTSVRNLVVLLDRLDQPTLAATVIGAIERAARLPSFGTEQTQLTVVEERTRQRLGHDAFERLHLEGRSAPFDQVVADVLAELRAPYG